jgi:hypothetical protein
MGTGTLLRFTRIRAVDSGVVINPTALKVRAVSGNPK